MDVIDRLVAAVKASGMKQNHVARVSGIHPTKLNKILKARQVPTVPEFIAIARAIHLDPGRLFTDGDLVIELDALRAAHTASLRLHELLGSWLPEAPATTTTALVPLPKPVSRQTATPVRAAANPNAELIAALEPKQKQIPRRAWSRGARIIARVAGHSMDGGSDPIADNELAYLKPTRSARTANHHIVLCRSGDGIYLKQFEMSGHTIRLVSANESYDTIVLDARTADLEIYGIVVYHSAGE